MIVDKIYDYLHKELPKSDGDWKGMGSEDFVYIKDDILYVWLSYHCHKGKSLRQTIKSDIMKELLSMIGKTPIHNSSITIDRSFFDDKTNQWVEYVGGIKLLLKYHYDIDRRVGRPSMRTLLGLK